MNFIFQRRDPRQTVEKQIKLLPLHRETSKAKAQGGKRATFNLQPPTSNELDTGNSSEAGGWRFDVSHVAGRGWVLWLFIFSSLLLSAAGGRAQEIRPSEYDVKAAFLLNFAKFVEWPTNAFAHAEAPLVIGVLGSDPFHGNLQTIVAGQKIGIHPVTFQVLKTPAEAANCQVLFIPAAAKEQTREALTAVRGARVLTVGETPGFCEEGGMINFIIENHQVHFDINNQAARAAELKISSKLLTLARRLPETR